MSEKLVVKICTGTLCYVMGGAELQLLEEHLPEDILNKVDIKGAPCLDFCNKQNAMRAPFVMVGDEVVDEASITKVVKVIKSKLK